MNRRNFCRSTLAAAAIGALYPSRQLLAALQEVTGDLEAVTLAGKEATLQRAAVQELSAALRGSLLLPGNADYDVARLVRNASIDKHPALIVQPSGEADVSTAVQFARDQPAGDCRQVRRTQHGRPVDLRRRHDD